MRGGLGLGLVCLAGRPARVAGATAAGSGSTLWLSWNENPLGLSRRAKEAAREALQSSHRYPDRARAEVAASLAERAGLKPGNVVLGCGSTQILQAIVLSEAGTGKPLILAEPTFEAVVEYQQPLGYRVEKVPLDSRYAHDLARMSELVGRRGAVVYLCNPNNPTATLTPTREIGAWILQAPLNVLFVIDEAYFEYVESPQYESCASWVARHPNVVVTRTFSKIYAMAGLRLGYALCHEDTAERLRKFVSADNTNGVALAAAKASLADNDLIARSRQLNARSKQIAVACLDELGLEHLPSHANFLMHRVPGDPEAYILGMRQRGIRVGRPFPPLGEFNRLTLGLPQEMRQWAAALQSMAAG